jgi:hypothetical protein
MLTLVLATAGGIGQIAASYDTMPDRIASHFDLAGNVDGWSSREEFAITMASLHIAFLLMFGAMRPLLRRIPDAMVNLPHKDWWLAPERRDNTHEWIAGSLAWMGALAQMLMVGITSISLCVSRGAEHALPPTAHWLLLLAFLLGVATWLAVFFRRFRHNSHA